MSGGENMNNEMQQVLRSILKEKLNIAIIKQKHLTNVYVR